MVKINQGTILARLPRRLARCQRDYQHTVMSSQARSVLPDAAATRSKSLRAAHNVLIDLSDLLENLTDDDDDCPPARGVCWRVSNCRTAGNLSNLVISGKETVDAHVTGHVMRVSCMVDRIRSFGQGMSKSCVLC
jgi:hypothetical protein